MRDIKLSAVQFEARDADKEFNFARIEALAEKAVSLGAEVVSFHECCITGYSFLQDSSAREISALAEPVPSGPSCERLVILAKRLNAAILAGLLEVDAGKLYNCYVAVNSGGVVAKHRKIHEFISPYLSLGGELNVFEMCGARCTILTCFDNNLVENPRIAALRGTEIIFAPHVTCGLQSPMPGRGKIDKALWDNRERDPVPLALEFHGPKGRGWLMRWLPARAYDNGVYYVFTNAVGVDFDTIKTGNAMIIDPFGEIIAESQALGDDLVVAMCIPEKIEQSSGRRYLRARRPELYAKLSEPLPPGHKPEVHPGWNLRVPDDKT